MGAIRYLADGLRNVVTGLGFGAEQRNRYTYCPLTQQDIEAAYRGSGIMRKIIDIPAFDAVRAGRDWQAEKDQITAIEAEEKRLGLWAKVRQAEVLRGLGGGALILGVPGDTALPMNPRAGTGSLAFIHVASRYHLTLGPIVEDISNPSFGGPEWFELFAGSKPIRLHPSRVVCFKADPLPNIIGTSWEDQFWGESRVARVLEAVTNSDTAQTAFAALIKKARYTRIGIPNLSDFIGTDEGTAQLTGRIQNMIALEGGANATIYDTGNGKDPAEAITDFQVTWTGMPEIMNAYDVRVAAVADIPMTRMFGRAAEGLNSSGDSQQKDWNRHVGARQELELRPCLEQLDIALIPSALGSRPPEIWWAFAPLDTPSEKEMADTFKTTMEAVTAVQNTGAIPDVPFSKGLQNLLSERAWMPGLDTALAELSEEERFGINPAPDGTDPSALTDPQQKGGDPNSAGGAGMNRSTPARRAANDARFNDGAAPKTLYIERKLINADEIIRWAKAQGLETTVRADDMHVTVAFSRNPVDWFAIGSDWSGDEDGKLRVKPGGPRAVERLGDGEAVALLFANDDLQWRHQRVKDAGASWDWEDYRPHVTLSFDAPNIDVATIKPYTGPLVFGPELFSEVNEDWKSSIEEE